MVNIDTVKEHARYQVLDVDTRLAVDIAFKAARKALLSNGISHPLANDDRAEELVAAIAHYVWRSKF